MPTMQTPRRREFTAQDQTHEVLDRGRLAHLATLSPQGQLEMRPMNYARVDEVLYFHTAPHGRLGERAGCPALACVEDTLTWLPSTWRHSELACPATTYYRSVVLEGRLRPVLELAEKARALGAFMKRYQPQGGYVPLDDPRYRGPLEALGVLALPIEGCCKVKMGQHLTRDQRSTVYRKLLERGDLACAREMARVNADLQEVGDGWVTDPVKIPAGQVCELLSSTYWSHKRSLEAVTTYLEQADLNLAWMEMGRVQAYLRATMPLGETAWLFDVVVRPELRGQGLGKRLVGRALELEPLASARRIFLDTRDAMSLYEKFGFVELARGEDPPRSLMMRGRV